MGRVLAARTRCSTATCGDATGDAGGEGCAGSEARDRYDLSPGESDLRTDRQHRPGERPMAESTTTEPVTADEVVTAPDERPAPTPARRNGRALLLLAVLGVLLLAGIVAVAIASDDSPPVVTVEVPAGTGALLDDGEVVEVVPSILRVEAGGSVEIVNADERLHVLGSLRADAGETVRLAFPSEGRYILPTSLRSDGQVTVLVEVAPDGS